MTIFKGTGTLEIMTDTVWIVTKEYNDYDQYGEYFVAAFTEKPDFHVLKQALGLSDPETGRLSRGGGRHAFEDRWYHLREVQCGLDVHKDSEQGL